MLIVYIYYDPVFIHSINLPFYKNLYKLIHRIMGMENYIYIYIYIPNIYVQIDRI